MPVSLRESLKRLVIAATAEFRESYPARSTAPDPLEAAKGFYGALRAHLSEGLAKEVLKYEQALRREAVDSSVPGAQAVLDDLDERYAVLSRMISRPDSGRTRSNIPHWACVVCTANQNGHSYGSSPFIRAPQSSRVGYTVDGDMGNNYPEWLEQVRPATDEEIEELLRDINLDMSRISREPELYRAIVSM